MTLRTFKAIILRNTTLFAFLIPFIANLLYADSKIIANNGFFMSFSGGGVITSPDYGNATYSTQFAAQTGGDGAVVPLKNLNPHLEFGWAVGAKLGYRVFLGDNWGLKTYLDYYYSKSSTIKRASGYSTKRNYPLETTHNITRQAHLAALNFDLFYRRDRLGGTIGIGLGYQEYSFDSNISVKYNGSYTSGLIALYRRGTEGRENLASVLALPLNVGITYDLTENDQLSINAKIPLLEYGYNYSDPSFNGKISITNYLVLLEYSYTF